LVAHAKLALESLASMQESHKKLNGNYAEDIAQLAGMAEDPTAFMKILGDALDLKYGLEMQAGPNGYRIAVHARDQKSTQVEISGPASRGP
jgi:hypothetical protein